MGRMGLGVTLVALVACGGGGGGQDGPDGIDGPLADAAIGVPSPTDDDHSGTRLKRHLYVGSDGFEFQYGWYDSLLDVNCYFQLMADGAERCRPAYQPNAVIAYRDAACTDRVLSVGSSQPAGELVEVGVLCGASFWRITQPIATPAVVYIDTPVAGCIATSPLGVYHEATPLDLGELVRDEPLNEPAGTRLVARFRTTADGARQFLRLHDPDLGADCRPWRAADDRIRCTPLATSGENPSGFADAACTTEVFAEQSCDPFRRFHFTRIDPLDTCHEATRYDFAPRIEHAGPVYSDAAGTCQPGTRLTGYTYSTVGATIAPNAMVAEAGGAFSGGMTRLRHDLSRYDDGAVAPGRYRMWDTRHGFACSPSDNLGSDLCLPDEYLDVAEVFADPACTVLLAESRLPCPAAVRPAFARLGGVGYYRLTGEFTASTVYRYDFDAATCYSQPTPASPALYTLDPTAFTDFETLTRVIEE